MLSAATSILIGRMVIYIGIRLFIFKFLQIIASEDFVVIKKALLCRYSRKTLPRRKMACLTGFEPAAWWFEATRSIHLSYRHISQKLWV